MGSNQKYQIVCAWCKRVLDPGDPGAPVSHGMCPACYRREMRKLESPVPLSDCDACIHKSACRGLDYDQEDCSSFERLPSRNQNYAGLVLALAFLGMFVIVAIRIWSGLAN